MTKKTHPTHQQPSLEGLDKDYLRRTQDTTSELDAGAFDRVTARLYPKSLSQQTIQTGLEGVARARQILAESSNPNVNPVVLPESSLLTNYDDGRIRILGSGRPTTFRVV
jgi:hypothetical protein